MGSAAVATTALLGVVMRAAAAGRRLRNALAATSLLLLVACGGGGDSPAPAIATPTVTTITVLHSGASVGVGQTQTVSAEARDQSGALMAGVSFTWASSNSGVATVNNGVVTGVAAGTAGITASSGGVTSSPASVNVIAVALGSVVIDKPSVFLSAIGQPARLTAQILDAQGVALPGAVTWTSSAPSQVSVDAAGQVVALAIGSAQIFAEAGGVRSAPTLAIVAQPVPGALLVTDAQVVSVGPPLGLAAGVSSGVGTEYEVTLRGVAAPAPGTMVIAADTAPIAGKVVATRQEAAGLVVRLALAPLYQLFSAYDIRLNIELSAFAFEPLPDRPGMTTLGAASSEGRSRPLAGTARRLDAFDPFKAFKCDPSVKPQLDSAPIQLSLENNLKLILEDRPGYSKHALEGSAAIVGSAGLKLKAGFKASGRCDAQGQIKIPIGGWFSVLAMPAVRFGLGAEVEGEVVLVQGELGVEGKVGFSPVLGWECGGAIPACRGLDDVTLVNEFKTKSRIPTDKDPEANVSAQFYVIAGLDASFFLGALNAGIVEARIGPKQSFNMAFEDDQAARPDYASTYDLKLEGVVEPGEALKKAIEKVIGDDSTTVKFKAEFSTDLSESPKGTLVASVPKVRPNEAVNFTVEFDAKTVNYWLLGENVVGVDLWRKRDDESKFTHWKSMALIASGAPVYQYRWVPTVSDAGKYEFAALVRTKIDVVDLEVAKNSIQQVEVSCFAAGSPLANPSGRARALATTARGAQAAPPGPTCDGSWTGTSRVTGTTPGVPGANIVSHANITWIPDPSQSGNGNTSYTPSGSFDLALNSPDGCTFAFSPSNFTIVNDPPPDPNDPAPKPPVGQGRLTITDNGFMPPSYGFGGIQLINTTVTASCPGKPDVVTQMNGFQVTYASGNGPFAVGQTNLSGSADDGAIASTWNFNLQ